MENYPVKMKEQVHKTELEMMLERKAAEEAEQKAQAAIKNGQAPGPDNAAGLSEEAAAQLAAQQAEVEQLKDQLLRARAEFDNYRKRTLREMEQVRQTASLNLIRVLLPILDNLERALAHANESDGLTEGIRLIYKQFMDALAGEGLEPIPARGECFDPLIHEALATVPSEEIPQGIITEEYERGYKQRNTVVRPSKVIVSSGPEAEPAAPVPAEEEQTDETASSLNE